MPQASTALADVPVVRVTSTCVELQRDLKTAHAEIAALRAERARISARLAYADAEISALRAARDAALRLTAWGPPQGSVRGAAEGAYGSD